MARECGTILHAGTKTVFGKTWQMQQQRESCRSLHQGADRGTAQSEDEISLPVARQRAVEHRRGPLTDQQLGRDERFAPPASACLRDA